MGQHRTMPRNERGVALLIALLVTALLIALIFEFAYGTRVSLRSAANFRDSERAAQLARSGIAIFAKSTTAAQYDLRELVPPNDWFQVPVVSQGDTDVKIKWEDEGAKIRIKKIKSSDIALTMFENLFTAKGVSKEVRDRMLSADGGIQDISLLSELHKYMSDDDYKKVKEFLTVSDLPDEKININTASPEVLESMGITAETFGRIKDERAKEPFDDKNKRPQDFPGISGVTIALLDPRDPQGQRKSPTAVTNYLTTIKSNVVTVVSVATVGDYTKETTAVIILPSTIRYWSMR